MSKTPDYPSINLKLSEELKEKVKQRADLKKQTVSKYTRDLLSNYFDGTLCKTEMERHAKKEFINSTEFLQLVVWMYSKKVLKTFKETPEDLENYIKTLKKIGEHFPKNLNMEFDKVLSDLIRVSNEKLKYSKDYKFADGSSTSPEFNFEILEKFLFSYGKPINFPNPIPQYFKDKMK